VIDVCKAVQQVNFDEVKASYHTTFLQPRVYKYRSILPVKGIQGMVSWNYEFPVLQQLRSILEQGIWDPVTHDPRGLHSNSDSR
jgi:hypothetical protein